MIERGVFSRWGRRFACGLGAGMLLLAGLASRAQAANYKNLPVVKPAISCEELAKTDLSKAAGAQVTIKSAALADTPKGQFCKVTGTVAPAVGFEVDLPVEHWTQRYMQAGCGGSCGNVRIGFSQASSCLPALNGEFVVASDDMGHQGGDMAFGADMQKRIDFAYRGNHVTALVAKELTKAFYGQGPSYSYFVGCSDGGREALIEAQRFPTDFDGIAAGAPVALIQVHNSFYHGWNSAVNKRNDGSSILLRNRLSLVHDAVVAHCDTLSGVKDGVLADFRACKFDPKWAQCAEGATDTSKCLTAEELSVAQKIYDGPSDAQGHHFEISGMPLGSEETWNMPSSATGAAGGPGGGGGMAGGNLKYVVMPTVLPESPAEAAANFTYTTDSFKLVNELSPLYNAGNTNLRPFQQRGGKLIVWHGGSDTSMPPATSVAYYQGVQKELGEKVTDTFMRFFLLPGVGHCGRGEGPDQIDILTPLMTWAELGEAPKMLIAGKTENPMQGPGQGRQGQGGPGGPDGPGPGGPNMAAGPGGQGGRGGQAQSTPYALPATATSYTRPIFPFPYVARYTGKGDPKDAANYEPVKSPAAFPQQFDTLATTLIGPDNQKFYHVENGQLVADKTK